MHAYHVSAAIAMLVLVDLGCYFFHHFFATSVLGMPLAMRPKKKENFPDQSFILKFAHLLCRSLMAKKQHFTQLYVFFRTLWGLFYAGLSGTFQGVFWYVLGGFLAHFGGFVGKFRGVFRYISGFFLGTFQGVFGTFWGIFWYISGGFFGTFWVFFGTRILVSETTPEGVFLVQSRWFIWFNRKKSYLLALCLFFSTFPFF